MGPRAWVLICLTVLVWGITPIIERKVLPGTDVLAGLTYRNIVSALVLTIAAIFTGKFVMIGSLGTAQYWGLAASALLGGTIGLALFFSALKIAPASRVIPLTATFPLVTYLLSVWLLGEEFTLRGFLGVIFIIVGAILLY